MHKTVFRFHASEISVPGQLLMKDVKFEISPGDKVLITGENGSGKSTFLKYLAGEIQNESSYLEFSGIPLAALSVLDLSKKRHLVTQMAIPYAAINVNELLGITKVPQGIRKLEIPTEVIDDFELGGILTKSLHHLSGGEWMRVRLAQAWLSEAEILLFDEADAPLHREFRAKFLDLILHSSRTIIAVSHNAQPLDWPKTYRISDQQLQN